MKVCHHQPRKFPLLIGLISFILDLPSAFELMEFYPVKADLTFGLSKKVNRPS